MQANCLFLLILFFRNHSYIHILLFFTYRIVLLLLCHYSKTLTLHYVTFLNQQKHGRPQHNFTIHFFKISIDLDILMKTLHICHSPINFIVSSLFLLSPLLVMLFPCSTDCCFSFSCLALSFMLVLRSIVSDSVLHFHSVISLFHSTCSLFPVLVPFLIPSF